MPTLAALQQHLAGLGRVVLGYSGGVDSALLAVTGRAALGSERILAVIGRSGSYPLVQWQAAVDLARRFDVPLLELATRELDDPRYVANTPDRCYFCKTELWTRLGDIAREREFDVVIDGTNADDLGEHRPGMRAALERGVRSPLAELGWRKSDVRTAARELGLPTWDAPASPCLSSRIRYGLAVTPARLAQVEAAEAHLRALGIDGDLRVRHHGATARIEVGMEHHSRLREVWDEVQVFFASLGFNAVELDPRGYRRGSLLAVAAESGR
jgi:pyridinium-3,5-biscarboxylic acid mononucleotide sulfurtransferase